MTPISELRDCSCLLLSSVLALSTAGCDEAARETHRSSTEAVVSGFSASASSEVRSAALPVGRGRRSPLPAAEAVVATDRFNSARVCGACHEEIFEKWSHSMHALAYEDPIFQTALRNAYYDSGGEAAALCLRCHSPTVNETKDVLGKQELSREGVTCDYCHSIAAITVDADGETHVTIDHSSRMSPFEQSGKGPKEHAVQFRPYFERSELCASCHDYTAPNGTVVFATYSEWRASRYAQEGTQCQDCHMPRVSNPGARPGAREVINDHYLQGGHSPSQIMKAVKVEIDEIVRDGDRVRLVVAVENSGAGHNVPTGLPGKMLAVGVIATQNNRSIFQREIVYQRIMLGGGQRPLEQDWEIKLRSEQVLRDNRLRPGEVRREHFVFDATPSEDVIVQVAVVYRYRPKIETDQVMEAPIAEIKRVLTRGL